MLKFKDYLLEEFDPAPDSIGFRVKKDGALAGLLLTKENKWLAFIEDQDEACFRPVGENDSLEEAIFNIEKALKYLKETNIVDFEVYKKKKLTSQQ